MPVIVQFCKYTRKHCALHLTWVNSGVCKLYLNGDVIIERGKTGKLKHSFVSVISIFIIERNWQNNP